MQFFPATPIREFLNNKQVSALFAILKRRSKPIHKRSTPAVLSTVGESNFERICKLNGWRSLKYTTIIGTMTECENATCTRRIYSVVDCACCNQPTRVQFPYVIEIAVFDRQEDGQGLKGYQCVNFMASTEDLLERNHKIHHHLGLVGIKPDSPVTVIAHLICPVLKWMNYGKSSLSITGSMELDLEKALNKILPIPKTPREYRPPPSRTPDKPVSWVPKGTIGKSIYEDRLQDFAHEILAIDAQKTRQIKVSARGWAYALEGLGKITKGEFDSCENAITNCRKLGFLPLDFCKEDQDETRRFSGIRQAVNPASSLIEILDGIDGFRRTLAESATDFWNNEKFYVMMCVEKGDIKALFEPICREYHVPIVSSKGWAIIQNRGDIATLAKKAEKRNLTPVLLLFYDLDPAGDHISDFFRKNLKDLERGTHWNPENLEIDRFGLNKEDVEKYGLMWIDNLLTSSGKQADINTEYVKKYIRKIDDNCDCDKCGKTSRDENGKKSCYATDCNGKRKCESNAVFRNDDTLNFAEEMCRNAIEKYYGKDAKERFKRKEEATRTN